jgi:hypothetical protein
VDTFEVDHLEVTEQIQSFRRRLQDGQLRACDTHFRSGSRRDLTGIGSALFLSFNQCNLECGSHLEAQFHSGPFLSILISPRITRIKLQHGTLSRSRLSTGQPRTMQALNLMSGVSRLHILKVIFNLMDNLQIGLFEGPHTLINLALPIKLDKHLSLPWPCRRIREEPEY